MIYRPNTVLTNPKPYTRFELFPRLALEQPRTYDHLDKTPTDTDKPLVFLHVVLCGKKPGIPKILQYIAVFL